MEYRGKCPISEEDPARRAYRNWDFWLIVVCEALLNRAMRLSGTALSNPAHISMGLTWTQRFDQQALNSPRALWVFNIHKKNCWEYIPYGLAGFALNCLAKLNECLKKEYHWDELVQKPREKKKKKDIKVNFSWDHSTGLSSITSNDKKFTLVLALSIGDWKEHQLVWSQEKSKQLLQPGEVFSKHQLLQTNTLLLLIFLYSQAKGELRSVAVGVSWYYWISL